MWLGSCLLSITLLWMRFVNDIAADKQHADRLERERLLTSSKRSCQNLALPLPLDVECASSFLAEQRLLQFLNEI